LGARELRECSQSASKGEEMGLKIKKRKKEKRKKLGMKRIFINRGEGGNWNGN